MTNLELIRAASDDELTNILARLIDGGAYALPDLLCTRCMKRHGGRCISGADCEAGDYSAGELVRMWLTWEAQS